MTSRSKREVAPPPPPSQVAAADAPWWPMAPPPGFGPFAARPPGEFMGHPFASAGWWPGPPPQSASSGFVGAGASWSAQSDRMSSEQADCGVEYSSPGGLLNYLQNSQASFPAPWPPACKDTQSPPLSAQHAKSRSKGKSKVIIDDGDTVRKTKHLPYTESEDERLASAWLHNSKDSINGIYKKNASYWTDVFADYNSTTPINRIREMKYLKDRFQKIKRWVSMFCGSWKKACSIYSSGQSDDILLEDAS